MKLIFLLSLLLFTVPLFGQEQSEKEVLKELDRQLQCWNNADLDCFMQGYWKSDSLMFIGKSGVNYGWQTTYDNYKKSYPDKSSMGSLEFEIINSSEISKNSVFIVGKWKLVREAGNLEGHFSLLWRKVDSHWVIIADHTS